MAKSKRETSNLGNNDLLYRVEKAQALIQQLEASFPEAHALSKADRRRSQGRLGLEEAAALLGVVDAIDMMPEVFASLADDDEGNDPGAVETDLIRKRFAQHRMYASVTSEVSALAQRLNDAALTVGSQVKPVTLAAYEIAKPISKRSAPLREKIAAALDYYTGNATAAVMSRRARMESGPPVEE